MDLIDEQWAVLEPLIPKKQRRADGRGRGGRPRYPSKSTCHKRFQEWVEAGVFEKILKALARDLKRRGRLDLSECFVDGSFVSAKKGAQPWARPNAAKAAKSWQLQTALVSRSVSPFTYRLLRQLKSPSLNRLLQPVLWRLNPDALSATALTTVIPMMHALLDEALN